MNKKTTGKLMRICSPTLKRSWYGDTMQFGNIYYNYRCTYMILSLYLKSYSTNIFMYLCSPNVYH